MDPWKHGLVVPQAEPVFVPGSHSSVAMIGSQQMTEKGVFAGKLHHMMGALVYYYIISVVYCDGSCL